MKRISKPGFWKVCYGVSNNREVLSYFAGSREDALKLARSWNAPYILKTEGIPRGQKERNPDFDKRISNLPLNQAKSAGYSDFEKSPISKLG